MNGSGKAGMPRAAVGSASGFDTPHATVVIVDLLPGSRAYCDTFRGAPPILVVDAGHTEVQFSLAGQLVTTEDLRLVDGVIQAWCDFKQALMSQLGGAA